MKYLDKIISRICTAGAVVGAIFLVAAGLLTVVSVTSRGFGNAISGSYEITELLMVVVIGFALAYTGLEDGHVSAGLLTSKLSQSKKKLMKCIKWLICLGTWSWVAWAGFDIMLDYGFGEHSHLLGIPYLPFRMLWVIGLFLLWFVFLCNFINSLKGIISR